MRKPRSVPPAPEAPASVPSKTPIPIDERHEWLETDGLGGFASGTANGVRTRRYHALLLTAATPPIGRYVLVNGLEAWLETPSGRAPLNAQRYAPDVVDAHGVRAIQSFRIDPWPTWQLRALEVDIIHELFVFKGEPIVALSWRATAPVSAVTLCVRPFFSGRDHHALHHENEDFRFAPEHSGTKLTWHPYAGVPGTIALSNGEFRHEPLWYRNFGYAEESARGLDCTEDLAAPGVFRFDLKRGEAVLLLAADGVATSRRLASNSASECVAALRRSERARRARFGSHLERAADDYLVQRGAGKTIVAGYPWFTDWGRDTFIAMRGMCLATGRLDEARDILVQWTSMISEGMLPNQFADHGAAAEYNSVDASLWYVIAVHDYLDARRTAKQSVATREREMFAQAVEQILTGHARGTRYQIHADHDGLLAAGVAGVQLTWMDAKVGDWVVTPRIGKPVEVQALWLNALAIGVRTFGARQWQALHDRARAAFRTRFWNAARQCLYDVVDVEHRAGDVDASLRPNQIFAVGGLPFALLEGDQARCVVDVVEARLCTPLGLRSLAPGEPGYAPRYQGGPRERDGCYHQGTVWPWLMAAFVEAWLRTRGNGADARSEARQRFLAPLLEHLGAAGLNHVSEIADAEPPHIPRGCPFQAWSVGELLRIVRLTR